MKFPKALIALAIAALIAFAVYRWLVPSDTKLLASGVLEARNINVGSKVGGRVVRVLAREGDRVESGQVLVEFDGSEQAARVEQARGRLALARANLEKLENGSRPEDIAESEAAARQNGAGSGYRVEELASARADLQRARTDAANAEKEIHRLEPLLPRNLVSRQAYDDAAARFRMAQAQVASLEHAVEAAEGRLRAAKAAMERTEHGFRREEIDAARAECTIAEGQLHEAEVLWAEREVRAPMASVVEVLDLRPGHLLQPNAIVAKLLEYDQLFVIVYVPETRIGRVRLGQAAEVRVDADPKRKFRAEVEQIRQQAEFLPRNVQTFEERTHQVIGVKLRVHNDDGALRAGIYADVRFLP
ncbi:MAG: HlyD family efflux transporter periplasmic adaptor subunit [Proteobacteria bacterium]|nr:HlyD family efflux transporter periplasmic adaptor subunit [Pseudomonadota bacterium]